MNTPNVMNKSMTNMVMSKRKNGSFTWINGKNIKVERRREREKHRETERDAEGERERRKEGTEQRREKKNTNYVQTEEHFSW